MGNVQKQVRAAGRRLEAVRLCQQGVSNEQIAAKLGIGEVTVVKYLNRYLETDSRFPVGLDADQISLMRADQLQHLEGFQRRLLTRAEKLASIPAYSPDEACALASATAKLCDSYTRVSERISAMYGLDAPRPQPAPANVTNNVVVMDGGIVERIKARRAEQAPTLTVDAFSAPQACLASGAE